MRRYHHYGIPTQEERPDETYVEVQGFKFYSTPFEGNKWHIQWHRFPEGHGLPELVARVPHIAFQVDDLDAELKDACILFGPYIPNIIQDLATDAFRSTIFAAASIGHVFNMACFRAGFACCKSGASKCVSGQILNDVRYSPLKGYRVAMIEEQGVPIELVETKLTDEELSSLEQEAFGKLRSS